MALILLFLVVISALAFGSFFRRSLHVTAVTLALPAVLLLHPLFGTYTTAAIAILAILGWLVLTTIADLARHLGDDRRFESRTRPSGTDVISD